MKKVEEAVAGWGFPVVELLDDKKVVELADELVHLLAVWMDYLWAFSMAFLTVELREFRLADVLVALMEMLWDALMAVMLESMLDWFADS